MLRNIQLGISYFHAKLVIVVIAMNVMIPQAHSGVINFSSFESTIAENGSSVAITVTRTGSISQEASVTITFESGTAKSPADFKATTTILSWAAGDNAAKSLEIEIVDDRLIEGDERFRLMLGNPIGDIIGAYKTHDVTIKDFEEGRLQFDSAVYSARESDGTIAVSILRTGGMDGDITVELQTTDATAIKNEDYVEANVVLTFLDGQTVSDVFIGLLDDQVAEPEEQFQLSLSNITGNAILGSLTTATARITDLDAEIDSYSVYLDPSSQFVSKSPVLDLNNSKFSGTEPYIDLINDITVLRTGNLTLEQLSSGIVRADIGDAAFFFWPTEINRNSVSQSSALLIAAGDSPRLYTDHDLIITLQPALFGISVLQAWLSDISLPEIVIADSGSITVRAYQGPPTFETKVNGEIVLSNSYFSRWTLRPEGPATKTDRTYEGVEIYSHPFYPSNPIASVFFKDGSSYRQQILSPAPFDPSELQKRIEARVSYRNVQFLGYGVIEFSILGNSLLFPGAETITLLSDYELRKSENFVPENVGFFPYHDVNSDGISDFKMIYPNGDEQYFLTKEYR